MRLVLEKGYYDCAHCTTMVFPEENEEGIRILDEVSETGCPVCRIPLVYGFVDRTQMLYCRKCRGMLLNQDIFLKVVRYLRAESSGPPVEPPPMNPRELERQVACPECGQSMSTHPYGGPGNIVVDNCAHCSIIWLDHDEFERIIRAPGRDRGGW
jgi:Zn-finger nucleic acid-binding protein